MFTVLAQVATTVLGLTRTVILLRILAPEAFGLVALALVFTTILGTLSGFGLNAALIQRERETPTVIATHFVLRGGFALIGFLLTVALIPALDIVYDDRPELGPAIFVLALAQLLVAGAATPLVLLRRRLAFKRIAVINVAASLAMTIIAPVLALRGWDIWSLIVGEQVVSAAVGFAGVWFWRRPWRVSLSADRRTAREYLAFGKHVLASGQLSVVLDKFDDFWTGSFLGESALGIYSKSYEFARYPRRLISSPLNSVLFSGFARLQNDVPTLSRLYQRAAGIVFRLNSLLSVLLFLVVPEFVVLFLGETWLPMVTTFRLLIIYSLFDPLFVTTGSLTTALGHPEVLSRIKLLQVAVFIPAVVLLGSRWGIGGVAVAADLMLMVGIAGILRSARRMVSFSTIRLLVPPLVGAASACGVALIIVNRLLPEAGSATTAIAKIVIASAIFAVVLISIERHRLLVDARLFYHHVRDFMKGSDPNSHNESSDYTAASSTEG